MRSVAIDLALPECSKRTLGTTSDGSLPVESHHFSTFSANVGNVEMPLQRCRWDVSRFGSMRTSAARVKTSSMACLSTVAASSASMAYRTRTNLPTQLAACSESQVISGAPSKRMSTISRAGVSWNTKSQVLDVTVQRRKPFFPSSP